MLVFVAGWKTKTKKKLQTDKQAFFIAGGYKGDFFSPLFWQCHCNFCCVPAQDLDHKYNTVTIMLHFVYD